MGINFYWALWIWIPLGVNGRSRFLKISVNKISSGSKPWVILVWRWDSCNIWPNIFVFGYHLTTVVNFYHKIDPFVDISIYQWLYWSPSYLWVSQHFQTKHPVESFCNGPMNDGFHSFCFHCSWIITGHTGTSPCFHVLCLLIQPI